jgi:hypothetical protein
MSMDDIKDGQRINCNGVNGTVIGKRNTRNRRVVLVKMDNGFTLKLNAQTLSAGLPKTSPPTLGEAVLAFDRLPEGDREQATIKVNVPDGATYTAEEIDRLHVAPKKKAARRGVGQLNRKAASSKSTSA